ncbi:hypothetical protein KGM48_03155 [Patescibacteria group bacterium]|nr:hypothetical protein [Patescibacteria group bacterium]
MNNVAENIDLTPNRGSRVLYVILSGITGGKDEMLVRHLSELLKSRGSVLTVQFANDPSCHDDMLPEMEEMTFDDCFGRLDSALQIAGGEEAYGDIVFITHSFSSIISTYYLGVHKQISSSAPRYTLITIDSDPSPKILAYLDSLDAEARADKVVNPFHSSIVNFMRQHDSTEVLKSLPVTVLNIDADDVGADHEFTSDESKHLLVETILPNLPIH